MIEKQVEDSEELALAPEAYIYSISGEEDIEDFLVAYSEAVDMATTEDGYTLLYSDWMTETIVRELWDNINAFATLEESVREGTVLDSNDETLHGEVKAFYAGLIGVLIAHAVLEGSLLEIPDSLIENITRYDLFDIETRFIGPTKLRFYAPAMLAAGHPAFDIETVVNNPMMYIREAQYESMEQASFGWLWYADPETYYVVMEKIVGKQPESADAVAEIVYTGESSPYDEYSREELVEDILWKSVESVFIGADEPPYYITSDPNGVLSTQLIEQFDREMSEFGELLRRTNALRKDHSESAIEARGVEIGKIESGAHTLLNIPENDVQQLEQPPDMFAEGASIYFMRKHDERSSVTMAEITERGETTFELKPLLEKDTFSFRNEYESDTAILDIESGVLFPGEEPTISENTAKIDGAIILLSLPDEQIEELFGVFFGRAVERGVEYKTSGGFAYPKVDSLDGENEAPP